MNETGAIILFQNPIFWVIPQSLMTMNERIMITFEVHRVKVCSPSQDGARFSPSTACDHMKDVMGSGLFYNRVQIGISMFPYFTKLNLE